MISFSHNRWLLVTIGHYVALFFFAQANYYLAPLGFQIFVVGMLISFSAMELNYKQGILSLIPVSLYIDSKSPLPFGFSLLTCITLFTIAHVLRSRVRREITASSLASSIMLNLAAFVAFTFGAIHFFGSESIHFGPIALNLLTNIAVVALFNRIFFDTQQGILLVFGINLAEEQREAR
ncbi:hypothetical protein VDG1235_4887 [Verrucomicrobiia bacterium DG1235]|nr:hypothetical protein VDG1235_4887 [Verrucomicrobiae bacterium DG1235]